MTLETWLMTTVHIGGAALPGGIVICMAVVIVNAILD